MPARALQTQVAVPDNGYVPPRSQPEGRTPAPPPQPAAASPFQPSPKHPQHGLNAPRPSLSPLAEYHSGFSDEDLGSAYPSPAPFNLASHRRQHSFPNLLPLAFKSRTPSPTRKTHARSPSEQMPYTGDGRSNGRGGADSPRGGGGGGLVSWLSGSAGAANALGLSNGASTPDTTPTRLRRSTAASELPPTTTTTTTTTTPKSATTTASRFMSAISSRFTPTPSTSTPQSPSLGTDYDKDELYNLNIEAALFPHRGPTSPASPSSPPFSADPFSPSAFKNLHMNAAGLLARMQTAYREQAAALRDLRAERGAERDELEEAVTRAAHLKMQLEGLAKTVQERDGEVRALEKELKAERRARAEAEERVGAVTAAAAAAGARTSEGASMVSEDLGVDEDLRRRRRRRRRRSQRSGGVDGGASCEEDDDSEDGDGSEESESVFSRCRSPVLPQIPRSPPVARAVPDGGLDGLGTPLAVSVASRNPPGSASATPKQKPGLQMSAFQKILKGIAGESGEETAGCANCKGQDASVAWDTVGLLRDENRHLKRRVGELEVAVEGALDLVNGIGM
ncbi:hypothetical protein C8A05DRAFT_15404 [Staphylotrichum tortipilum]|uniref:Uncharacterized protein n=1 Tax=Staphylotrichum tortipilum TaxID=2831512 RepID=A0AAN6RTU1_9PEZI|nr:hypothetical protein C8A05DRAFT_15404 [Staphylotrichum longicolle]